MKWWYTHYDPPGRGIKFWTEFHNHYRMSLLNYGDRELIRKAKHLRNNMTKAEVLLWSKLRMRQIEGLKFRRQQPILSYIVDFYCDQLKLIIEVDGKIHSDNKEYDYKRELDLTEHGFNVLRFTNEEVEFEINSVLDRIRSHILKSNSTRFIVHGK